MGCDPRRWFIELRRLLGRLPSEANDPAKMAAYASERGWAAGAKGFTNQLREHLQGEADRLDLEVGIDANGSVGPSAAPHCAANRGK